MRNKTYRKGLTAVEVNPGFVIVKHVGIAGNTQDTVRGNVDALFGEGAYGELRKGARLEEGTPESMYSLRVARDEIIDFVVLGIA